MEKFGSVNEILDFAINAEQEAVDFYSGLAAKASNPAMKEVFLSFSREEMEHKARLMQIRDTGIVDLPSEQVMDMKIADYTVSEKATDDLTYTQALVIAMKKEKAAFRLYMGLSEKVSDGQLKELFLGLAMEESKHKLRFELEYDEYVLREN